VSPSTPDLPETLEDAVEGVEAGLILMVFSSTLFWILGEVGGLIATATEHRESGTLTTWVARLLGIAIFLLGARKVRTANRRLYAYFDEPEEVRKAQWAWALGAGLLMLIAATFGLAWLVEVVDFSGGLRISYSQEERARPMALAFALYGAAGLILFVAGAVGHLRIRPGRRQRG
jgi:acetyl-CoA carboxylase alpha subunit